MWIVFNPGLGRARENAGGTHAIRIAAGEASHG